MNSGPYKLIGRSFILALGVSVAVFAALFAGALVFSDSGNAPLLAFLLAPAAFFLAFVAALAWHIPKVRAFTRLHQIIYYGLIAVIILLVIYGYHNLTAV